MVVVWINSVVITRCDLVWCSCMSVLFVLIIVYWWLLWYCVLFWLLCFLFGNLPVCLCYAGLVTVVLCICVLVVCVLRCCLTLV